MTSYVLQRFGPGQPHHSKVPWPVHLESTTCTVPTSFIKLLADNTRPSFAEDFGVRECQSLILDSLRLELLTQHPEDQSGTTSIHSLEKQLFICDVILSPFRRLPNDVLYEIVLHCPQYFNHEKPNPDSIAPTHFPYVLSQVSTGWKEVVFKMSSLWLDIRMESINWHARDIKALKQRGSQFAQLSRARPLSVDLRQIRAPPIPNTEDVGPSMRWVVYSQDNANKIIHGFHRALTWVWMR
ncbi:hypothetical protein BJ165DRAFT_316586 [Panaeolus papilionaceus]|nr:hypothetical protein BJ165DRAFT_316586 [Panaeolus papilionaceus]